MKDIIIWDKGHKHEGLVKSRANCPSLLHIAYMYKNITFEHCTWYFVYRFPEPWITTIHLPPQKDWNPCW